MKKLLLAWLCAACFATPHLWGQDPQSHSAGAPLESQQAITTGSITKPSKVTHGHLGLGYSMMLPMGSMQQGWSSAHGVQLDLMFGLSSWPVLKLGVEGNICLYAYKEQPQDYLIFNGVVATSEVSFTSYLYNVGAKALFEPPKNMPVKPYASLHGGVLGMYSQLSLDDFWEDSNDDYEPEDTKTLIDDADWYGGIGGGVKFDLNHKKKPGSLYLDLNCSYLRGGNLKYANMNRLYTTALPHDGNLETIKIVFINTTTSQRQEQEVAEVYRHNINLLNLQAKVVFQF